MQIAEERWEYELTTTSAKFMQQMTSLLSYGGVVFVANTYCSLPTKCTGRKLKQACRRLRHSLVRAISVTVCCSKC